MRILMAGLTSVAIGGAARAATLTVGPAGMFQTVAAATAASQDGDTVAVQAGTYTDDFAEIRSRITLLAVGGRVTLHASTNIPNNKAILIADSDLTVVGFTFTGARVPTWAGSNGAGIRLQGGNLTVRNCYFHNNQEGILGGNDPAEVVTITGSEFAANGVANGPNAGYEHNLYIGHVGLLSVDNSYFHNAVVGHEIKTRALVTTITNSRIADGATGTASYSIDAPNGGVVSVSDTVVQQGPLSQNAIMIAFGEEGGVPAGSSLTLQRLTLINDLTAHTPLGVWNAVAPAGTAPAFATATSVWGLTDAELGQGDVAFAATLALAAEPAVSTRHPWLPAH